MTAPKKLKVTITFDDLNTLTLNLSDDDYMIVRAAIAEARLGNALQIDINNGLRTSYPEMHSGTYQHIGRAKDGHVLNNGPLWTAEEHPFDGYHVLNAQGEFVRRWGASND
jgi:hypothetical protein